jgi:hypothetical protein
MGVIFHPTGNPLRKKLEIPWQGREIIILPNPTKEVIT